MDDGTTTKTGWIKGFLKELGKLILLIVFVVIPFRLYIAQPFLVSGASMTPTFQDKDYLIVDQISFKINDLNRQDVIVFKPPFSSSTYYIKRVIGFPGETIIIKDGAVTIKTKDNETFTLEEPYIVYQKSDVSLTTILKNNEYFVMGDNRAGSYDSRSWGPLGQDRIIGRPFIRILPLTEIGIWPGHTK